MDLLSKKLTVLLIDDDRHLRGIIKAMLLSFPNITFLDESHAAYGWDAYCQHAPDLIIVDWEMPKVNGLQFIRRVRHSQTSPYPETPLILLTGHTTKNLISKALDAGVDQVLSKPVSADLLFKKMTAALSRQGPLIKTDSDLGRDRRHETAGFRGRDRRSRS